MRFLYIYPHPDDESFGPAAAMHSQIMHGHEVFLLTLTKGGATKQRKKLGLSVAEMGELRATEMNDVKKVLRLSGMTILDFPDSGLAELDPRQLENAVRAHLLEIKPEVIVTYPVHGISGFHDHVVTHAIVKRVFVEMKDAGHSFLKRLAFYTIPDSSGPTFINGKPRLRRTASKLLDCAVRIDITDLEGMYKALDCYESYKDVIAETGIKEKIGNVAYFEIFGENHKPHLHDLADKLP